MKLYLLGHPVGQSLSPTIQNAALRKLGVAATYETLDIEPTALESTLERLEADSSVLGCNVTVPHKVAVHNWLLQRGCLLRSRAEISQAVNTLFRGPDGLFQGDSTDFEGALGAVLRQGFSSDLDRFRAEFAMIDVAILGAGGSARSIATHLVRPWKGVAPKSVTIFARDPRKAKILAADCSRQGYLVGSHVLEEFPAWNAGRSSLVIQTTTVGMMTGPAPDQSPIPNCLEPGQIAFDLVYKPHETVFLTQARGKGARIVHGIGMLVGQGALSLSHWCNSLQNPPIFDLPSILDEMTASLAL